MNESVTIILEHYEELKVYRTKTRKIKEYIEEQYFERKVEDEKI